MYYVKIMFTQDTELQKALSELYNIEAKNSGTPNRISYSFFAERNDQKFSYPGEDGKEVLHKVEGAKNKVFSHKVDIKNEGNFWSCEIDISQHIAPKLPLEAWFNEGRSKMRTTYAFKIDKTTSVMDLRSASHQVFFGEHLPEDSPIPDPEEFLSQMKAIIKNALNHSKPN